MMEQREIARRTVLKAGASAGAAGLTTVAMTGPARAFPGSGGEVLPWLDQPAPIPPPLQDYVGHQLVWESLDSRITPNAEFFTVRHYNEPQLTAADYRLDVSGLVRHSSMPTARHASRSSTNALAVTATIDVRCVPPSSAARIARVAW